MYIIGLTGNIATGKSTVCEILEQLGARVIDADKVAHVVLKRGTPAWRSVVDAFGYDILQADGNVDRRKLGAVVFGDPAKLRTLEQISHPAVGTELALMVRDSLNAPGSDEQILVVEAVKLYEAGMHEFMDALWVVTAPPEEQRRRLIQDRGMSESDADARLAAQPPLDAKLARADVVIDNGASIEETRVQVLSAFAVIDPSTARDKTPLILKWLRLKPKTGPAPVALPLPAESEQPLAAEVETAAVGAAIVAATAAETALKTKGTARATPAEWIVRRAKPSDARSLADLLTHIEAPAEPLGRSEMLERQGKYAYWLVLGNNRPVALAAWQAENLAAIVRELWVANPDDAPHALPQLLTAIETEANALTCEVVVILVPARAAPLAQIAAQTSGYALTTLDELNKLWRSVIEPMRQNDEPMYAKRLREIVTKPI